MRYYFFLDETGDHGLSFIDKNFPLFLLCGCLIRKDKLEEIDNKVRIFKLKYFKTNDVILHSRDIRKCEGVFQILFNLTLKESFYSDLNHIIEEADYKIIAAAINKEEHIKKYGKGAADPYSLSLSFIIERLIFCLDDMDKKATVDINTEERGSKEDKMLISDFNSILDLGTFYISPERLKERITSFKFHNKRDNIIGLQIADLNAYPLARHLLNPKEPYIPFKILENKIYCSKDGERDGWGLKSFP
jgi:hypothetical protein